MEDGRIAIPAHYVRRRSYHGYDNALYNSHSARINVLLQLYLVLCARYMEGIVALLKKFKLQLNFLFHLPHTRALACLLARVSSHFPTSQRCATLFRNRLYSGYICRIHEFGIYAQSFSTGDHFLAHVSSIRLSFL